MKHDYTDTRLFSGGEPDDDFTIEPDKAPISGVYVDSLTWINRKAGVAVVKYGYGSVSFGTLYGAALVGPDGCAWLGIAPHESERFASELVKHLHERLREEFSPDAYERLFGGQRSS